MTQSQKLRNEGLEKVSEHNSLFKSRALARIADMRRGHLRTKYWDRVFTWEQLLPDVEFLVGFKVPHENLNGAVCKAALSLGLIEETGKWIHTQADEKHARRSPQYRWALYA